MSAGGSRARERSAAGWLGPSMLGFAGDAAPRAVAEKHHCKLG